MYYADNTCLNKQTNTNTTKTSAWIRLTGATFKKVTHKGTEEDQEVSAGGR